MSETTAEAAAQEPQAEEKSEPTTTPTIEALQAKLEEVTKEARKWEARSKENHQAKTELEKQQKAAMTDAERAVAEAETRGRTAATVDFGKRLATAEIRAAALDSGRDLTGVFDYLDLTRFLDDDGEPDEKAIKAFVDGLPVRDDGKPRAPRPDANQGRSGAGGPKSTADSFAEFFKNSLPER